MRLVVDSLIAVMLLAVLAAVLWQQRAQADRIERVEATQHAIRAIESQALFQASLGQVEVTRRGFPLAIDPAWFTRPPANAVAPDAERWIDSADAGDAQRFQPDAIIIDGGQPAFWYNAHRGVVRARVAMQASERATIDLYNLVNGTSLRVDDVDWPGRG